MKFRKIILVFLFAGIVITTTQSCQKYPDGPFISFRSRTERVAQTWKVSSYQKNGTDNTSLYGGYTESYSKGGAYSYSWGILSGTGTWGWADNQRDIQLNGAGNQGTYTMVILKLEQAEFWYYYMDGSDKKEFHMVPN